MILEVKNGSFGYTKDWTILENINISVDKGEILAILGPNGIGKTTLLKCMIGLQHWKTGETYIEGKPITQMKPKELFNMISYIPQSHGFSFSYTGLEMVMFGRSSHLSTFGQPGEKDLKMAKDMMERIGISHLASKDCNRMSGGELQMVLIAKALINEPKLIILDEPETGLDFHNQLLVLEMIKKLAHEEKISAIINTHYPTNALSISDKSLMMNRRGEYYYGNTVDVLTKENISRSFDINVVVNEFFYEGRDIRSIVPVSIA